MEQQGLCPSFEEITCHISAASFFRGLLGTPRHCLIVNSLPLIRTKENKEEEKRKAYLVSEQDQSSSRSGVASRIRVLALLPQTVRDSAWTTKPRLGTQLGLTKANSYARVARRFGISRSPLRSVPPGCSCRERDLGETGGDLG